MNTQTKKYLIIIGVVIAIAGLGWFGYTLWSANAAQEEGVQTGGFTVYADKQPSLDRGLSFPEGFPEEAKTIVTNNVESLVMTLKEDPANYAAWLDLAIQYKTVGDYDGAAEVWEYLNIAAPTQSISFQNLGSLYSQFAKDYEKAEENYLNAIERAPNQTGAYLGLADLYHYSYKTESSAAVDILKQGIANIPSPQNVDLIVALAAYYKDVGDKTNAIKYYEEARDAAKELLNTSLEQQLTLEINTLR